MSAQAAELTPAERLRITFELHDLGVQVKRQQLRRQHPQESDEEIERRLSHWLRERPGAESGDTLGRVGDAST